ncbi:hypothetical protein D3C81_2321990 [compost metagenome]
MQAIQVDILGVKLAGFEQLLQMSRDLDQGKVIHLTPVHEELAIGGAQVLSTAAVATEQ